MSLSSDHTMTRMGGSIARYFGGGRGVLILKWAASIVQILGYSATAFGLTPLNIYLFLIGLMGWFTVGLLWRDKAIVLIHIVALGAMIAGLANG